jgi:hypothetical protein
VEGRAFLVQLACRGVSAFDRLSRPRRAKQEGHSLGGEEDLQELPKESQYRVRSRHRRRPNLDGPGVRRDV